MLNINNNKDHSILLGENMDGFVYLEDAILSEKHLNLILECFLSKKLYENDFLNFDIYEKIKEEIDDEIGQIKSEFKRLLKDKNVKIHS